MRLILIALLAAGFLMPGHKTLFIGDSVTAGTPWPGLVEAGLHDGSTYVNIAPGATSSQTWVDDQSWVQSADRLFVFLGFNDQSGNRDPAVYGANIATIIGLVGAADVFLIAAWDFDAGGSYDWSLYKAQLESIEGVTVIDLGPAFDGQEGLLQEDGIHPLTEGHTVIADVVIRAVRLSRVPSSMRGTISAWPSMRPGA